MEKQLERINQSVGLLLDIDRDGEKTIQQQIVSQLLKLIKQGVLPPGTILPPSRRLAEALGVNRTTVVKSYLDLWSLGHLDSRPGSYTRVRRRAGLATESDPGRADPFDWGKRLNQAGAIAMRQWLEDRAAGQAGERPSEKLVDFTPHFYAPDDERPLTEFRKALSRVMVDQGRSLVEEYSPRGHLPLRRYLAQRIARFGISASAEEIIVTAGLKNSLDLLARVLVRPGSLVLVESPTAAGVIPLLRFHQARVGTVPITREGLDLGALRRRLAAEKPAFLLTMPNFQIPTGIVTSQSHREELLTICQKHDVPIVESGFEEEMACFGRAVLPIKSMDRRQLVVHLGSFSHIMMVGVQVSWIVASQQLVDALASVRAAISYGEGSVVQAAVLDFCQRGRYDVYIKRMLTAFRKRMRTALRILRKDMSRQLELTEPGGGYVIWLKLRRAPAGTDPVSLFRRAGVKVSPGRLFQTGQDATRHFRLSISSVGESQIIEGLRRMRETLEGLGSRKIMARKLKSPPGS